VKKSPTKPISLKEFAALLELSQSTVSRIINGAGAVHRIAEETQQRVLHAAALHGYSANSVARSLRQKRTYTVGVIVPEISEGYATAVLSGIEDELLKDGFFYFVVSHRHRAELLAGYPRLLLARSVEGIIAVDTPLEQDVHVPLVSVSGLSILSSITSRPRIRRWGTSSRWDTSGLRSSRGKRSVQIRTNGGRR